MTENETDRRESWQEARGQPFDLEAHEEQLLAFLEEVRALPEASTTALSKLLHRHPGAHGQPFAKVQVLKGYRQLCRREGRSPDPEMIRRLQIKPTRTISGVAPVAVLTAPHPCPGRCIFCPAPEGLPTSYLDGEPGVLRALDHDFDPYDQTAARIATLRTTGHNVDKIELLVLGGTWSAYPVDYQEWFIQRCLDAMNEAPSASLEEAQERNEGAAQRNVGITIETRPDWITPEEVRRLRWLGATKVQLGLQSLDDALLARNRRGHTVAESRRAMRLLRLAGFKIVVHWMPNLLGATPESDRADFQRLWDDPALRPDELKIYPTSLLPETELYRQWQRGAYRPYDEEALVRLLAACKTDIPPYCRVNRLMRDIPAPHIVAGVTKSNLRQIVQQRMAAEGLSCRCIRCREVRGEEIEVETLRLDELRYDTDASEERFLQYVTPEGKVAGFLRLSLPRAEPPIDELRGCAVIREVHVYGPALELEEEQEGAAQHSGLGTALLEEARRIAWEAGYRRLAVIAAVGTRPYYRGRGFRQGERYMVRE